MRPTNLAFLLVVGCAPGVPTRLLEDCHDGIDNDADDLADCNDPDCGCDVEGPAPSMTLSSTTEMDADGDGYNRGADCHDGDPTIHPSAEERCDGVDQDCDGAVDEDAVDTTAWYQDEDSDGYGVEPAVWACQPPAGWGATVGDCDDAAPDVHPAREEICNQIDDDCDGLVDDEDDSLVAMVWYLDVDRDGFGASDPTVACDRPPRGEPVGGDCDDADPLVHPDSAEICNDVDDDCDGWVDDDDVDVVDALLWYEDLDGDGAGVTSVVLSACAADAPWVRVAGDCDDGDGAVSPYADEVSTRRLATPSSMASPIGVAPRCTSRSTTAWQG